MDRSLLKLRPVLQSLGCEVYRQLVKDEVNLCFSPLSFMTMMMVLLFDSKSKWISNQFPGGTEEEIQEQFRKVLVTLTEGDSPLIVSQGLFVDSKLSPLRTAFIRSVETYRADIVSPCHFTEERDYYVDLVNQWVAKSTKGTITQIIDQFEPLSLLVVLNAFYFKDDWQSPFAPASLGDFYLTPEKTVKTRFMRVDGYVQYGTHRYGEAIRLDYQDPRFGLLVILPTTATHQQDLERDLDAEVIQTMTGSMRPRELALTLPKFSVASTLKMDKLCRALDIPMTDWTHISDHPELTNLTVIQKAVIDVHEKGTMAAAAMFAGLFGGGFFPPKLVVTVNRPFLFAIIEKESNLMLFMGRYQDPHPS